MRIYHPAWLILPLLLLWGVPAAAGSGDDYSLLGGYQVVIGDLGVNYNEWSASPTRVFAQVIDAGVTRSFYFDSVPAAFFVLREVYHSPDIILFDVQEYVYASNPSSYVDSYGLINGHAAFYVWDYNHYSRGGLPLVLAFSDLADAREELSYRDGKVMDFREVMETTYRWLDAQRSRIYWRGWDSSRWDNDRWYSAWSLRWNGWSWDNDLGWCGPGYRSDHGRFHGRGHHGGKPWDDGQHQNNPPPSRVAPSFPPEDPQPPKQVDPVKPAEPQAPPENTGPTTPPAPQAPHERVVPKDPPKPADPPKQVKPKDPPAPQPPPKAEPPQAPPAPQPPPKAEAPKDPPKAQEPQPEKPRPPEKVVPKQPPEKPAPPEKGGPTNPPDPKDPPKKVAPSNPPEQKDPPKKVEPKKPPEDQSPPKKK